MVGGENPTLSASPPDGGAKMRRTQLTLDSAQFEFLQEESRKTGKCIPDLLREWIDDRMKISALSLDKDPLWGMVAVGASGSSHGSEEHDRILSQERVRRMSPDKPSCS